VIPESIQPTSSIIEFKYQKGRNKYIYSGENSSQILSLSPAIYTHVRGHKNAPAPNLTRHWPENFNSFFKLTDLCEIVRLDEVGSPTVGDHLINSADFF
jgi:hypothetical protein